MQKQKRAPVLCGVGDGGDELHSFGIVVDLSVQSQIALDEVTRGHEPLPIFVHDAGILREGDKQKNSTTAHLRNLKKNCIPLELKLNITSIMFDSVGPHFFYICLRVKMINQLKNNCLTLNLHPAIQGKLVLWLFQHDTGSYLLVHHNLTWP